MREHNSNGGKCSFCNELATASWHGTGEVIVTVCKQCALNTLPALAADAIRIPTRPVGSYQSGKDILERRLLDIERAFWRAVAIRPEKEIESR